MVILGACIGLWIVVVEQRLAPALLKIVSGRLEGREFVLDKPRLTLGRDERGDIPIFDDAQIQPHHATLHRQGQGYTIQAEAGASIKINQQAVAQQTLHHEDELIIGQTRLIYRQKEGAASVRSAAPSMPPQPHSAGNLTAETPPGLWLVTPSGQRYPLRPSATTIGRVPGNAIVLDDATISAHHATVQLENGRYILYDQNSRNGTFVNGHRVSGPHMIKSGWQVQMGDVLFTVQDDKR